jgi:hypothetical protein
MRAIRYSAEFAKPPDSAGRQGWLGGGDLGGVLGDSEVTFRSLETALRRFVIEALRPAANYAKVVYVTSVPLQGSMEACAGCVGGLIGRNSTAKTILGDTEVFMAAHGSTVAFVLVANIAADALACHGRIPPDAFRILEGRLLDWKRWMEAQS